MPSNTSRDQNSIPAAVQVNVEQGSTVPTEFSNSGEIPVAAQMPAIPGTLIPLPALQTPPRGRAAGAAVVSPNQSTPGYQALSVPTTPGDGDAADAGDHSDHDIFDTSLNTVVYHANPVVANPVGRVLFATAGNHHVDEVGPSVRRRSATY